MHSISPHRSARDDAGQTGTSLVEVMIVVILTAVILGVFYGSAASVSTMTIKNNTEAKSRGRQVDVLDHLRRELEQSGNDGRFTIPAGGKSIIYTKLIGAKRTGADVSGLWSPTFQIELSPTGEVSRKEGSKIVTWGGGVRDLTFAHNPGDAFITVTCTTTQEGKDVARTEYVYPLN